MESVNIFLNEICQLFENDDSVKNFICRRLALICMTFFDCNDRSVKNICDILHGRDTKIIEIDTRNENSLYVLIHSLTWTILTLRKKNKNFLEVFDIYLAKNIEKYREIKGYENEDIPVIREIIIMCDLLSFSEKMEKIE